MVRVGWSRFPLLGHWSSTNCPGSGAGVGLRSALFLCAGLGGGLTGVAGAAVNEVRPNLVEDVDFGVGFAQRVGDVAGALGPCSQPSDVGRSGRSRGHDGGLDQGDDACPAETDVAGVETLEVAEVPLNVGAPGVGGDTVRRSPVVLLPGIGPGVGGDGDGALKAALRLRRRRGRVVDTGCLGREALREGAVGADALAGLRGAFPPGGACLLAVAA